MSILEHPIYKDIYELCLEIEKLPASLQETKVVVMASALEKPVAELLKENADLKAKLAHVEADAAAMRELIGNMICPHCTGQGWYPVLRMDIDGREREEQEQCEWCARKEGLLTTGSGQRLLDELATLRFELQKWKEGCQANAVDAAECHRNADNQRLELIALRATAQRRLELLRKCEWSMPCAFDFRNQCPICKGYIAEHTPDCPLAAELNQNGPAEYTEPIHDHGAYGTAMKKESK